MKFIKEYQTRWHDTDCERLLRPSALLVYMQETSNLHVASTGLTLDELRDTKGLAFILSKIRIVFHERPKAFERLLVETFVTESHSFRSVRYFRILSKDRVLCEAESTWALIDTRERKLHRFDETGYCFEGDEPLTISAPARTRAPSDISFQEVGVRRIVYSDLDYNMHMNNTRYPDMLCDFLPLAKVQGVKAMSLSYINEAAFGKELRVLMGERDGYYYFKTLDENGTVCLEAVVQTEN